MSKGYSVFARGRKLYVKIKDVQGRWIQKRTGFSVGFQVEDYELVDLAERVVGQLDDFAVVLAAAAGRGRTAEGDALADRLWAEIGGRL